MAPVRRFVSAGRDYETNRSRWDLSIAGTMQGMKDWLWKGVSAAAGAGLSARPIGFAGATRGAMGCWAVQFYRRFFGQLFRQNAEKESARGGSHLAQHVLGRNPAEDPTHGKIIEGRSELFADHRGRSLP